MMPSIKNLYVTLRLSGTRHKQPSITMFCHYAESRILFIIMLNVIMLSVVMLNIVILSVVMLRVMLPNLPIKFYYYIMKKALLTSLNQIYYC